MRIHKRWIYLFGGIIVNITVLLLIPADAFVLRSVIVTAISSLAIGNYLYQRYGRRIAVQSDLLIGGNTLIQFLLPVFCLAFYYRAFPDRDKYDFRYGYALTSFAALLVQAMFFAGYESIKKGVRFPLLHKNKDSFSRYSFVLMPLFFSIWAARLYLLYRGAYFTTYQSNFAQSAGFAVFGLLNDLGLLILASFFLMGFLDNRERGRKRLLFIAVLVLAAEIFWYLPSGLREPTAKTIAMPVLVYVFVRRKVPWKTTGALMMAGLLVFPVWSFYRNALPQHQQKTRVNYRAIVPAFREAQGLLRGDFGSNIAENTIDRIYDGKYFGYLLTHYARDYDWRWGTTYRDILFVFVPRVLAPDKPRYTMALPYKLVAAGSIPTTLWGEAYINFSWVGLIVIPYIFGLLMKGYDYLFIKNGQKPFWIFLYLYSAIHILRFPVEILGMWVTFFSKIVILAFFLNQTDIILRKAVRHEEALQG